MIPQRQSLGSASWHASPALLHAYARGRASPADTWSVEAHLIACVACRSDLASVLRPSDTENLATIRQDLIANLPARTSVRGRSAAHWLHWVLRPAPLIAVGLAVLAAAALDVLVTGDDTTSSVLWLLTPAIPAAGVALTAVGEDDPCWEAVLAAPAAVIRLALWRTLVVLLLAVPLAAGVGALQLVTGDGTGWSVAWLLPCLALTVTTLAVGSFIGIAAAGRTVASLWCLAALGPSLLRTGGDLAPALRLAAGSLAEAPMLLGGPAQVGWAITAVLATWALHRSRNRFQQPQMIGSKL